MVHKENCSIKEYTGRPAEDLCGRRFSDHSRIIPRVNRKCFKKIGKDGFLMKMENFACLEQDTKLVFNQCKRVMDITPQKNFKFDNCFRCNRKKP